MQSKDHYILGTFLLEKFGENISPLKRKAFLFGCIEPDLNPFTYMRGSLKNDFMRGHNAENVKKHTHRIIEKLRKSGIRTAKHWFELGTALHYAADGFTFPHNSFFSGTLKEHVKYESLFHPIFEQYLQTSPAPNAETDTDIEKLHGLYVCDKRSFLTDCKYITKATVGLCRELSNADIFSKETQNGERENIYA